MNQRPTRAPSPPAEDIHFDEVEPARVASEPVNHAPPAVRMQQALPPHQTAGPVEQPVLPNTGFAKLAAAIAGVMAEIKPVEKSGWNDFHKYKYAKMGDLSIELTPLMGRHGIVIFQNEVDRAMFDDGKVISVRYQFTVVHSSGEIWPERPLITGMSRCRDSKGGFDDKAFNKAHTAARKYFLLSLFQIPTDDEVTDDADAPASDQRSRPSAQRRAPSPEGKVTPHLIPIVNGEAPAAWASRFIKAIEKSDGPECDLWYNENYQIFEKLKTADEAVYSSLIDAMDARTSPPVKQEEFAEKKDDPISSGPPAADNPKRRRAPTPPKDDGFPGDKPMVKHGNHPDQAFDEAEWLQSIGNAYSSVEDTSQLMEAQGKYMTPYKEQVSETAWSAAVGLTKKALKEIESRVQD